MAKTARKAKNSLKFSADESDNVLSARIAGKTYKVPATVRKLASDKFIFLSFRGQTELYEINGTKLRAIDDNEDATQAFEQLRAFKKRATKGESNEEAQRALAKIEQAIPEGYKLSYNQDGSLRLVRKRVRSK